MGEPPKAAHRPLIVAVDRIARRANKSLRQYARKAVVATTTAMVCIGLPVPVAAWQCRGSLFVFQPSPAATQLSHVLYLLKRPAWVLATSVAQNSATQKKRCMVCDVGD